MLLVIIFSIRVYYFYSLWNFIRNKYIIKIYYYTIVFYYEFKEGIDCMKPIVNKQRIMSSILLFLLTMSLFIYLHNHHLTYLAWWVIMLFIFLNRKILGDEVNLTNKEEIFLVVSYIAILVVFIFLIYNITVNKIINN